MVARSYYLEAWVFDYMQMDARSLSLEMAPLIMWPNERKPELFQQLCNNDAVKEQKKNSEKPIALSAWDMLEGLHLTLVPSIHGIYDQY